MWPSYYHTFLLDKECSRPFYERSQPKLPSCHGIEFYNILFSFLFSLMSIGWGHAMRTYMHAMHLQYIHATLFMLLLPLLLIFMSIHTHTFITSLVAMRSVVVVILD